MRGKGGGLLGWLDVAGSGEEGVKGTLNSGGVIWRAGDAHTNGGAWTEQGAHILLALADVGSLLGLGVLREVCVGVAVGGVREWGHARGHFTLCLFPQRSLTPT